MKRSLLLLLLAAFLLAACGGAQAAEPAALPPAASDQPVMEETAVAPQDEFPPLRIVTSFRINSLDPVPQGFWMPEFGVAELLLQVRADGQYHPWLLESLAQVDELTWRLTLRPGITFQNGKPLDAAALSALIERQLALSPSAQGEMPAGSSVAIVDELTVDLITPVPSTTIPSALSSEGVFPVYDVEAVAAVGDNFEQLAGAGFYTGPYSVVSLTEEEMVLERYDDYWQGRPALPGVSVRFVSDAQARILAVQNDEADIALYPPTAAKPAVDASQTAFFNYGTPSTGGFRMVLNIQEPPFNDMAVRQAIIRAIDYEQLANEVMDGVFLPATGFYAEWLPWSIQNQQTDLTAAQQILDEAGWLPGGNGIRQKDGQSLSIILLIYPQQPDLEPISVAIQSQLRQAGFAVEISSVDGITDAMLENLEPWQAGLVSSGSLTFGGAPEPVLKRGFVTGGDRNYANFSNAELDALVKELSQTFDEARRTEILHRLQVILIEEEPYQFYVNYHTGRVIVGQNYRHYQPGFNLFHVSYETQPTP